MSQHSATVGRPRRNVLFAAIVILCGAVLSGFVLQRDDVADPAPLAQYAASVEQGRYLALIGNCASCHTAPGGKPYAGGVEFQTPFGTLYSTNITTDVETGIGSWSFTDFYHAMKRGIRPDGVHLYPAFPYPAYARLTDADIASLYLYINTLAPQNVQARP